MGERREGGRERGERREGGKTVLCIHRDTCKETGSPKHDYPSPPSPPSGEESSCQELHEG